jgi:tetratricopeptide (TPR) repeat protein
MATWLAHAHLWCAIIPRMKPLITSVARALLTLLLGTALLPAQTPAAPAPANSNDPAELVKQGRKLNNEGKQDEALALYQQALKASPDLYDAHIAAGIALDLKGDYEQARHHLARAIEIAPPENKAPAQRTMAMSYAFEGRGKDAEKYEVPGFNAQMAKPDYIAAAEIANELARVYLESGDTESAHKWYQTGYETALRKTDLSEKDKDLWSFRWEHAQARIAARQGKKDEAQKHVAAAKAILDKGTLPPDQARYFPYLTGYVAFYTNDYKTAIAELQKADKRDPFILSLLAQAFEKTGDNAQAMDYYRKVLASNAHNPTGAFSRPLARKKLASAQKS